MHRDKLPEGAQKLLDFFSKQPEMQGAFVLIGGAAIALHHGHRMTADLDFRSTGTKLSRAGIERLLQRLRDQGADIQFATNEAAIEAWENDGDDLLDYQQDWTINGVKVTFFADNDAAHIHFINSHIDRSTGSIAMLSSDALFESKARLLIHRSTSRDLYDLWFYLAKAGKTMDEIVAFAKDESRGFYGWDFIKQRLLPAKPASNDPGFEPLLSDGPANFDELKLRLAAFVEHYEETLAGRLLSDDIEGNRKT